MPHTRSEDIGNIAAGALKFGAGFFRAKPSEETIGRGVATAGTPSRISPTLRDRVSGAFGATRGVQAFEAGRATIEGQEALTGEREARAGAIEGEAQAATQSFRLSNFLSPKLTTKLTQALIDVGADVDGNGIITDVELNKGISKIDTKFLSEGISEGVKDLQSQIDIVQTSDGGINKLIEKANASMLASGQTISEADFRTNPELATTFPKIAQSIARKDQLEKQIGQFKRAEEGVKGMVAQPTKRRIRILSDPLTGEVKRFDIDTGEQLPVGDLQEGDEVVGDTSGQVPTGQAGTQVIDTQPQRFISPESLRAATGPVSGTLQAFNNLFGFLVPGQIAPNTSEARNRIRLFNKNVVQSLVINPRAPVAEQAIIQGFLTDPSRFFADPDEAVTNMLNLRVFLEDTRQAKATALARRDIGKKQRAEFTEQVTAIDSVLGRIPTREQLSPQQQTITVEDVNNMTIDEIVNVPLEGLSREVEDEMIRRLEAERR